MLQDTAAEDRTLLYFPRPFLSDASPYEVIDFDQKVLEACRSDRSMKIGIKVAKVVIVGDIAVGKTCLVNRFCHEIFDTNYKSTIGVDFEVERFDVLNTPFNLQIWDTAGQERFQCIAASYYRGARVVLIVFDMSSIGTLMSTSKWLEETIKNNPDRPLVYLIGTKKDLIAETAYIIVEEQAIKVANSVKAELWIVSSKSGENVQDLFFRIAAMSFNESILREFEEESSQTMKPQESKKSVRLNNNDLFEVRQRKLKCSSSPKCSKS